VQIDFRGTLNAAKGGDEEAFALLWREYQPGLLRYLRVKSGSVADDLAADTWLRVVRALPNFEGDEHGFRAWLFTTARNRLTDWYRRPESRLTLIDITALIALPARNNVESEVDANAATIRSLELIAKLPPDQAEAVMLRTISGLSVAATAEIMERSVGSVRVLCHRGLRRLEEMLQEVAAATVSSPTMIADLPLAGATSKLDAEMEHA
jgi:RNA polymerase sigma-70 factor (ECF subfamily)